MKISQKWLAEDSCFYGGIMIDSDHTLVRMKMSPEWWKFPGKEHSPKVINRDNSKDPTLRQRRNR